MKILLGLNQSYFNLGGAATACRGLIEGLAQRGHSCAMVSIENRQKMVAEGFKLLGAANGIMEFERDGIKVFAAENPQEQWRPMLKCLQTFDPDWTLISEQRVLLLTIALEEHDPSRVVLLAQSIVTAVAESSSVHIDQIRSLVKKTAGIITVSNYMRDYIQHWSGLDSTVLHFPSYGSGPFSYFNNVDTGYVTIINPCWFKGISIFLSLARNLPQVKFAFVPLYGTLPEDRVALERLPNMTLLRPSPNLDDIFRQTKVLLVPSLWGEAFGQVVIDAMVRGVPVLASNAGGLPEAKLGVDYVLPVKTVERYERDSKNRMRPVVPEQDVTPWLETLNRVLTDRALYERLSLESRAAALTFVNSLGPQPFEQYLERLAAARKSSGAASA